jgi:hypothetical protein
MSEVKKEPDPKMEKELSDLSEAESLLLERKLLALASNPSDPIWKDILPSVLGGIGHVFRSAADLAEVYAKATGCHCGHEIAKMIMDAAPKV